VELQYRRAVVQPASVERAVAVIAATVRVEAAEHDGAQDVAERRAAQLPVVVATITEDDVAPDVTRAIASQAEALVATPLAAMYRMALAAAAERRATRVVTIAAVIAIIAAAEHLPRTVPG